MNPSIETVIVIHVPSEWRTTNRRWAFRSLAETLPAHAALLCVNRPVDPVVTLLRRPGKFIDHLWSTRIEPESERLSVVTPRLIIHEILAAKIPGLTAINRKLWTSQLNQVLRRTYPNARRVIQWIHHPNQRWVFDAIPDAGKVYHCYDEYTCTSDGVFQPKRWQRELQVLREADLTFVSSSVLIERRKSETRRIELVPNGFPSFFLKETQSREDSIDQIPPPRIGYVGNIFSLLEFELLEALFAKRTDWQMVFVGSIQKEELVKGLRRLSNVHFVGPRAHEDLPVILERFDAGLIPITINEFTRPLSPLKMFEYLGAGLPIVSTAFFELGRFSGLIELVENNVDEFEKAIERTLKENRAGISRRLKTEAESHTWTVINREFVVPVLADEFKL